MIQGWYYMHINKEFIYKDYPDAINDIRDSDFCHSAWAWDGFRQTAWAILVEAMALGVNRERLQELACKWKCDDIDAKNYADFIKIKIGIDGDSFYATRADFINIQESPIGFGDSYLMAMSQLAIRLGYKGGKMWNATFEDLVK